ncbi:hypothetical protein Ahy_A03g016241 [Arachis hypogaea]|uniref:Reverse transcriptase zinc-binding domain-containing protein n=1 Tax=Arachis hypogaea TaxID=3818 RepID=A0A445E2N5_ARAHY|nr:hypothetical protein Ahy_A03g016241 [Arachis hypogaea]
MSLIISKISTKKRNLSRISDEAEIRKALFSIGSLKVPGSDGFPALLYKNNWDLMKEKVEGEGVLRQLALEPDIDINSLVWEWTDNRGGWNTVKLRRNLPESTVQKITTMLPPSQDREDDRGSWKHTLDGDFSVASTYKALNNGTKPTRNLWMHLWDWKGPQRVKTFFWVAMHGNTLTN